MGIKKDTTNTRRLGDKLERKFIPEVESVLKELGTVPLREIEGAIRSGVDVYIEVLPSEAFEDDLRASIAGHSGATIDASSKLALTQLPKGARFKFDLFSRNITDYVAKNAANKVVGIANETRLAIRETVKDGLSKGLDPRTIAKRVRPQIGLNTVQARANNNYFLEQFDKLTSQGVSGAKAEAKAGERAIRKAKQQVRSRSLTISRTETFAGISKGRQETWKQGMDRGYIPRKAKKGWRNTGDNFVRDSHRDVFPVPVGSMFRLGSGVSTQGPGLSGVGSEDINCRCVAYLIYEG